MVFRYRGWTFRATGCSYVAYHELTHGTPVEALGERGMDTYRLYLSNPLPVAAGRLFYGLPKLLSDVQVATSRDDIGVAAHVRYRRELRGPCLLYVQGRRRVSMYDGLEGEAMAKVYHGMPAHISGLSMLQGQTLQVRWNFDLSGAWPVEGGELACPGLEKPGLLERWARPCFATGSDLGQMRREVPERL